MMGARLVSQVFTHWKHLPDRPFRLLCHMALICKDAHEKPTYWAGRDDLADALGLAPSQAAYQSVKRALRQITAAGAAEIAYHGHARKNTEYRLTLDRMPPPKGVTHRPPNEPTGITSGGHSPTPSGGHSVNERGSLSARKGVTHRPPKEPIGAMKEHKQEIDLVPDVSGTRPNLRVIQSRDSNLDSARERLDAELGGAS